MSRRIAYWIIGMALCASAALAMLQVNYRIGDPTTRVAGASGIGGGDGFASAAPATRSSIAATGPATQAVRAAPRPLLPDEYAILRTRNVFGRGRGRGAAAGGDVESSLVYRGVVQADSQMSAFIEDLRTKNGMTLSIGDPVGRGRITSIDIDALMYEAQGQTRRIEVGQNLNGQTVAPTPTSKPSPGPARGGPPEAAPPNPPAGRGRGAARGAPPVEIMEMPPG